MKERQEKVSTRLQGIVLIKVKHKTEAYDETGRRSSSEEGREEARMEGHPYIPHFQLPQAYLTQLSQPNTLPQGHIR